MRRVLLGLMLALAGYEVVAVANRQRGDTISEVVWELTTRRPLVPFACGMLAGHLFWQREVEG